MLSLVNRLKECFQTFGMLFCIILMTRSFLDEILRKPQLQKANKPSDYKAMKSHLIGATDSPIPWPQNPSDLEQFYLLLRRTVGHRAIESLQFLLCVDIKRRTPSQSSCQYNITPWKQKLQNLLPNYKKKRQWASKCVTIHCLISMPNKDGSHQMWSHPKNNKLWDFKEKRPILGCPLSLSLYFSILRRRR